MANFEAICRVCLDKDAGELHHIFDESLNNKIIIITGLDVNQTDSYPKKICTNCRYQLEKSYYFRMLAKQSEIRLRKFVRLSNQNKEANHVLERDYKDDDIEEYEEQLVETYNYFDDINQQIEEEKRKCIHEELLKLKSKFEPPNKPERPPMIPKKPISTKPVVLLNKCPQNASSSASTPSIRRKQTAENVSKEIPIEISEVQVVDNSQYEIRILQTDANNEELQIVEIEKGGSQQKYEIISENAIVEEYHEIIEEAPAKKRKLSPAKKSPKKLQRSEELKKENANELATETYFRIIDESENPETDENNEMKYFQCAFEDCKETFSRRQQCKTHYYNHLAVNSNFSCKYCSKKFKIQSALDRHERVHTNSKPFICETCNKGFSQKEMLKRHMMIHLPIEEAKFACKICDKRFRQKDPLNQHMLKVHSNDVPKFQCNLCDKSFAHPSGLSRHLLLHSGKMFTCEVCQRQFNDHSALKRHGSVHSK